MSRENVGWFGYSESKSALQGPSHIDDRSPAASRASPLAEMALSTTYPAQNRRRQ
jgi:hypothetical protein